MRGEYVCMRVYVFAYKFVVARCVSDLISAYNLCILSGVVIVPKSITPCMDDADS